MSTATKYHFGRNGQVAPCEASVKPCPLGGVHYDSKEEAQYDLMDMNVIRNHWRVGGMPGDGGWYCNCGWRPGDTSFSGLAKVNAHADGEHAKEVAEAKQAWVNAKKIPTWVDSLLAEAQTTMATFPEHSQPYAWRTEIKDKVTATRARYAQQESEADSAPVHNHNYDWACAYCGRPGIEHTEHGARAHCIFDAVDGTGFWEEDRTEVLDSERTAFALPASVDETCDYCGSKATFRIEHQEEDSAFGEELQNMVVCAEHKYNAFS